MSDKQNEEKPKVLVTLEEDDEFEDFPVEDWNEAESEVKLASNSNTQQLWEEDWDHDDAEDDFSAQLKEELSKTR